MYIQNYILARHYFYISTYSKKKLSIKKKANGFFLKKVESSAGVYNNLILFEN